MKSFHPSDLPVGPKMPSGAGSNARPLIDKLELVSNYFPANTNQETAMNPTPPGWPRIAPAIYYDNAREAIDWLCRAFGFEVRIKVEGEGGRIEHSELAFDGGLIMVSDAQRREKYPYRRSPSELGGVNTQNLMVYVDDVEAHVRRARAAGATIVSEPQTQDYGEEYWTDRGYECVDLGGHHWWFYQRLRTSVAQNQ